MTSVRCPICNEVTSGDSELALTHSLRDHMTDAHELKELCETDTVAPPLTAMTEIHSSDRNEIDKEMIRQGKAPSEMEEPEMREETVLCPFCGARLFGKDENGLSVGLRDHMEDIHDIKAARGLRVKLRY
jgi:hypothetical protein